MFQSILPQALIDGANSLTDNDGYNLVSATQFVDWINNELTTAWGWMGRSNRDIITKVTSQFSIVPPQDVNGISMTASSPGLTLTDFSYPRGVEVLVTGNMWKPIRKWSFTTRNQTYSLCYRFIGETMLVQPYDQSTSYPYRVWYVFSPPVVAVNGGGTLVNTAISIPANLDEYIKQGLAAKIRIRLDDDPAPHWQAQGVVKQQLMAWLRTNSGDQSVIADVDREGRDW